MFAGKKSAQIREILISESAWEEMTCLFAPSLALAFQKWGISWEAVGAYNAGFRRTDRQAMRRLAYARKIEVIYRAIKTNKNAGQPHAVKK